MKNQYNQMPANLSEHDVHNIVSQISNILKGFSARRISPQTTADVLRAQIFESHLPVDLLSKEICNSILEAVTSANSVEDFSDIISYISTHREFLRPKPLEMFAIILKTSDSILQTQGVSYYQTEVSDNGIKSRIKYFHTIMDMLKKQEISDMKMSFIIEWIFEKALVDATLCTERTEYISLIEFIVEKMGTQIHVMRSFIFSIQKDISYLLSNPPEISDEIKQQSVQKAQKIASNIFHAIVTASEKNENFISKFLANWVAEIPLQNEDERFFKQVYWRWIRTLSSRIWDGGLREPPLWVTEAGSAYCATIFQIAPAYWLQEYSLFLLERVHKETLTENFTPVTFHYDYVEFLARSMRKKSPFFASRPESLYAIQLLSRLTRSEKIIQNSETVESLGSNPVTRALTVLVRLAKETAG